MRNISILTMDLPVDICTQYWIVQRSVTRCRSSLPVDPPPTSYKVDFQLERGALGYITISFGEEPIDYLILEGLPDGLLPSHLAGDDANDMEEFEYDGEIAPFDLLDDVEAIVAPTAGG